MPKSKRTRGQTIIYKALHRKLKIEQYKTHWKPRMNSDDLEGSAVHAPLVAPVVLRLLQIVLCHK